jgi:hypothetical protein
MLFEIIIPLLDCIIPILKYFLIDLVYHALKRSNQQIL